jgi:hypothetical protein
LELLSALSRWIHVLAGIVWIGMLYFFNFVNIPFQGTQDGDTKKKVNPELLPRALFWFRWGAAWTWVTGLILLQLVFWGGQITVDPMRGWSPLAIVMLVLVFVAPFLYDVLAKSPLGKNPKAFGAVAFFLLFVVICLMSYAGFTYRAYNIHLASLLGTIMAWNVGSHLAGAEDPPRGQGGHGAGRRAPGAGRRPLAPQHLHVGAAALGHGQLPHHLLLGRQPRHLGVVGLRRLPGRNPDRLAHRLAALPARGKGEGLLSGVPPVERGTPLF